MLLNRAHVYAMRPTAEQAARLWAWVGTIRCTYNLGLEQRRFWRRPNWLNRRFSFQDQCKQVTLLRAEFDWMRDVPVCAQQQALRDLEQAYQNWWSGKSRAPTPRKRGRNDAMRFNETFSFRRLSKKVGEVQLPKIGWIRIRWDRALPDGAKVRSVTVRCKAGEWFVSAQYELEVADPVLSEAPRRAYDLGVNNFAACSDGTMIPSQSVGKKASKRPAKAQRALARKKRGSKNRHKARMRVAKLHARIKRARLDFLHKASATVAKNHGTVVLELLRIVNMTASTAGTVEDPGTNIAQKRGLNRSILDQGWGLFVVLLAYKLARNGGRLIQVNPAYSSQTCSACGHVAAASRQGSKFDCVACGHAEHADTNAAKVILARGQVMAHLPVEGGQRAPDAQGAHAPGCEAGTVRKGAARSLCTEGTPVL